MHELSIAQSLVSVADEAIQASRAGNENLPAEVHQVHLRLGRLAGVVKDALLFCYDIASEGTSLAGSELVIEELPVIVFCHSCEAEVELPDIQRFRCPHCGTPSGDIRQGRELELATIHFRVEPAVMATGSGPAGK